MSRIRSLVAAAVLVAGAFSPLVLAQALLPANDRLLRDDVTLLADEGVIDVLSNAWPIPAEDVALAVGRVKAENLHSMALQLALLRLQSRFAPGPRPGEWGLDELWVTAGDAPALRDYGTLARSNAEIGVAGGAATERWSVRLALSGAVSPEDRRPIRFDGTEISLRLGNWLISANQVGRWWGPGMDGSLILSTNASPMPGVSIDRVRSTPFDFPVLRWFGPWRLTGFIGAQEGERLDVDHSLFMAGRISFKPAQIVEFGASRTAQFCGSGRPCGLGTVWKVWTGKDNEGIRVRPEDEPGNQMAGFDARLVSPWQGLPVAVYAQLIGEDGSSTGIPERYLGLFGFEAWWSTAHGDRVRARLEYADTSCKFYSPYENPNCSYRQNIFFGGYRYRARNIGHSTDADSESFGASLQVVRASGELWTLNFRRAALDRYGAADAYNPLTFGAGDYHAGYLSWQGRRWRQELAVQLGYERFAPGGRPAESGPFGFVRWRHHLNTRN